MIYCPWEGELYKASASTFVERFESFLTHDRSILTEYQKCFYNSDNYIETSEFIISDPEPQEIIAELPTTMSEINDQILFTQNTEA